MGEHDVTADLDEELQQRTMRALLTDVRALERLLEQDRIESGIRRIGAEQEMFLITRATRPSPIAVDMLDRMKDPAFTTELGRFNLEANLEPHIFGGDCLRKIEVDLEALLHKARATAAEFGSNVLLTGILPTIRMSDLSMASMVPNPRYYALNRAMSLLRGGDFHLRLKGLDEIDVHHDNVMLEACNTSFQVHFQVGAAEFARLYNLAQAVTGPVLAAAVNSPILLGRRLWKETRIGVFQHSVDTRAKHEMQRGARPRVHFGDDWIKESVVEIFKEDIARFRVVLAAPEDEDSLAAVAAGRIPSLPALRLHNGTVYRWNRACYGVQGGVAHLRIENRVLPAGPTIIDEVANAAFFFGLMAGFAERTRDIREHLNFSDVKDNFLAAARHGLKAQFTWFGGDEVTARDLILKSLLPIAREGLEHAGLDMADIDRYLGVLEARVASGQTGAVWSMSSYEALASSGSSDERCRTLTSGMLSRQLTGKPVHEWSLVNADEATDWREGFRAVGQFMKTELFTVRPTDLVDFAAAMMDWEHIRHVPVEDAAGNLVGLVSHRSLLRLIGRGMDKDATILVESIMKRDPLTVTPETPSLDAIRLMRAHGVGCLPVVDEGKLVGLVTASDFLDAAVKVFEQQLREVRDA